jgi:hypothetical protein
MKQSDNDMNIDLLRAMRDKWIIEIERLEKKIAEQYPPQVCMFYKGKLAELGQRLEDLIIIIGED